MSLPSVASTLPLKRAKSVAGYKELCFWLTRFGNISNTGFLLNLIRPYNWLSIENLVHFTRKCMFINDPESILTHFSLNGLDFFNIFLLCYVCDILSELNNYHFLIQSNNNRCNNKKIQELYYIITAFIHV